MALASIQDISTDVLGLVFDYAFDAAVTEACSARFVCRDWATLLKPLVFRTLKLTFSIPREKFNRALFECLRQDASIASLIRYVEVLEWYESGFVPHEYYDASFILPERAVRKHCLRYENQVTASTTKQVELLRDLLPFLRLSGFSWQARPRMPGWLLAQVQKLFPKCKLEISLRVDHVAKRCLRKEHPIPSMETISSLQTLRSITCLRSLGVALAANKASLFLELQSVLESCPRLKKLSVYAVAQPTHETSHFYAVEAWPWSRLPAKAAFIIPHVTKLSLQNICICHDQNESLLRFVPWSELRSASFSCPSFLVRLKDRLQTLRSLSLKIGDPRDISKCLRQSLREETRTSLISYKHLQVLRVENMSTIIDDESLQHIGARLSVLDMHENENYFERNKRNATTHLQIVAISKHCPLLTDLKICMRNDLTWPTETFDLIGTKLSYIRRIEMHFELGRNLEPPHVQFRHAKVYPQLTAKTAQQIFRYIQQKALKSQREEVPATRLREIVFSHGSLGAPDRPLLLDGYLCRRSRDWTRNYASSLVISENVRANSEHSCSLKMSFPELERLQSVQNELSYFGKDLDKWINLLSRAWQDGPQLLPETVLDAPGFAYAK